uniref:Predicted protein n=1 Tax=Hordeum vulgare subsp. vulgare TaxID=112509 RepID=F2EDP5_HORVV|nr:predicted protein [Hordeum vulgare subsp. vulgare]BAK07755.1 predicted protein [Hordeum vulgare subsp. vulgare]
MLLIVTLFQLQMLLIESSMQLHSKFFIPRYMMQLQLQSSSSALNYCSFMTRFLCIFACLIWLFLCAVYLE